MQAVQCFISTKVFVRSIARNRKSGTAYIVLAKVGKGFLEILSQSDFNRRYGDSLLRFAKRSRTKSNRSPTGQTIKFSIWNIIQTRAATRTTRKLSYPNSRVYLVKLQIEPQLDHVRYIFFGEE